VDEEILKSFERENSRFDEEPGEGENATVGEGGKRNWLEVATEFSDFDFDSFGGIRETARKKGFSPTLISLCRET